MIKDTKKSFLKIVFAITLGAISSFSYGQGASGKGTMQTADAGQAALMPADLNISADQMQKMEAAMEGMEKFYENLSPAEKEGFEKELAAAVQAEQKKLATMPPAAQKQYVEAAMAELDNIDLEDLMRQLGEEEDDAAQDVRAEDKPAATKPTASAEAEKEKAKQKIKETLDLINNIIKVLNSLNEKLNGIKPHGTGAQILVDKWIKNGKIQRWAGQQSSWSTFNKDLQAMKQRLEKLKKSDPSTGKYYYLDDIKTVDKLYGQLDMLYSTIKKYEPNLKLDAMGKVKDQIAKSALKKLVEYLADTTKIITKSADDIISKFEKQDAPKIKKQEESKAEKAKKKPSTRGKTTSVGTAEKYEDEYAAYASDSSPSYYGPYAGSSYSSYTPSSDYTPDYSSPTSSTGSGASSSGKSPSSDKSGTTSSDTTGLDDKTKTPGDAKIGDTTKTVKPDDKVKIADVKKDGQPSKETEKKYAKQDRKLSIAADKLETFEDNFKLLKEDAIWISDLPMYLSREAAAKEFTEKIDTTLSSLKEAETSFKEFVEIVNTEVKDSSFRKKLKDKALEAVKEHEKTENAITTDTAEAVNRTVDEKPIYLHESKKKDRSNIVELRKIFSNIKNSIKEIK